MHHLCYHYPLLSEYTVLHYLMIFYEAMVLEPLLPHHPVLSNENEINRFQNTDEYATASKQLHCFSFLNKNYH